MQEAFGKFGVSEIEPLKESTLTAIGRWNDWKSRSSKNMAESVWKVTTFMIVSSANDGSGIGKG